jgi:hypothetical protein
MKSMDHTTRFNLHNLQLASRHYGTFALWSEKTVDEHSRLLNHRRENRTSSKPGTMEIHLSKPGGKKEGPYTAKQINRDLAAGKYRGSDYWAWYQGLPDWIPLYSVPGIIEQKEPAFPEVDPSGSHDTEILQSAPATASEPMVEPDSTPEPESSSTPVTAAESPPAADVSSGMPCAALEQIFVITTGEGPDASRSPSTAEMLERITGLDFASIRAQIPRDVIGRCNILEGLKGQTSTQGSLWGVMARLQPELLQKARDGLYRICIRTFRIDNGDLVSLFLFYNKEKF